MSSKPSKTKRTPKPADSMRLDTDFLPGGKAHDRRGELAHDLALKFIEAFPIGTLLSEDRLDAWLAAEVGIVVPARDTLEWKGHGVRRHGYLKRIKSASTHPRMWESGQETYDIVWISTRLYEVQPIQIKVLNDRHNQQILSLLEHVKREIQHHMQATKWEDFPPHAIGLARHLLHAKAWFIESIDGQLNIQRKLANDLAHYQQPQIAEPPSPRALPPGTQEDETSTSDGA